MLMYLGDLNGNELDEALRNACNAGAYYVNVLATSHHGNAVVLSISNVSHPRFTCIPRFNDYVNSNWVTCPRHSVVSEGLYPMILNHGGLLRVWVYRLLFVCARD